MKFLLRFLAKLMINQTFQFKRDLEIAREWVKEILFEQVHSKILCNKTSLVKNEMFCHEVHL